MQENEMRCLVPYLAAGWPRSPSDVLVERRPEQFQFLGRALHRS